MPTPGGQALGLGCRRHRYTFDHFVGTASPLSGSETTQEFVLARIASTQRISGNSPAANSESRRAYALEAVVCLAPNSGV